MRNMDYPLSVIPCVDYDGISDFARVAALTAAFGEKCSSVRLDQIFSARKLAAEDGTFKIFYFARYII